MLLQLLQAWGTPIHYDESYYWMYSKQLAFGYFDHPPAVAFLIYLSDTIFNGILGVRFFTIIAQVIGFYLLWQMIADKVNKKLPFVLLLFCLPFFHILGVITTPDVPLLFSALFFFYSYQRVLKENRWVDYLLWGVSMAALLYSKYHGVLLIFFILISNPRLFLNPKTYFAGGLGLLLWAPHLAWQYLNDFPSFRYHLQERAGSFKWFYPLEYIGNVLLIFNPILIWLLVKKFRIKSRDLFERGLIFTFFGFLIFFALQTFRDHVQPQWVVLCYIPIVLLLINNWNSQWNKKLIISFWITLPLLLVFRFLIIFDVLPKDLGVHKKASVMKHIQEQAGDKSVMFINSYKNASLYSWYTGIPYVHSYNTYLNRKNQFNLWNIDSLYIGKEIFLVGANFKKLKGEKLNCYGCANDYYGSFQEYLPYEKLAFELIEISDNSFSEGSNEARTKSLQIHNPYTEKIIIGKKEVRIFAQFYDGKKSVGKLQLLNIPKNTIEASTTSLIKDIWPQIMKKKMDSATHVGFCASRGNWPPASIMKKFEIED